MIHRAESEGIYLRIVSGYRTRAEQEALYAKGRTAAGSIVTNARGGRSYHNYGLAVDVVEIKGNVAIWNNPRWSRIGQMGKSLGLTWGGDWSFKDYGHFQLDIGRSLDELTALKSSGLLPWLAAGSQISGVKKETPWFDPYRLSKSGKSHQANLRLYTSSSFGVYLIKEKGGALRYIGMSEGDLRNTLYRHFQVWNDPQQERAVYDRDTHLVKVIVPASASLVSSLESQLIASLDPRDNERGKYRGSYKVKTAPVSPAEEEAPF